MIEATAQRPEPKRRLDARASRPWRLLLASVFFSAVTLAALSAGAQEQGPDDEDESRTTSTSGIEEIVVRGSESESSRDFAAGDSVTGFGAEDLAALGAADIGDLAAFTPNLEIVTSGATTPTFFIRGVGLNDFNSNSTGAVAIYQDDVARNAPALQLSTLFDVEAVNVLRGPQGTGLARNASAGAIKIYSKKPTGDFGGYLSSELGNYDLRDFQGAIEAPLFKDILASRFAFRFTQRDGTMKNRCGNAPKFEDRVPVLNAVGAGFTLKALGLKDTDAPWSQCGEPVDIINRGIPEFPRISDIPEDLPSRLNDRDNWAARGTLLFQPTLDMSWLLSAHGARRDEWTQVGQSIGTGGFHCTDVENCSLLEDGRINGVLGGSQGADAGGYVPPEIRARLQELAPCITPTFGNPSGNCKDPAGSPPVLANELNDAKIKLAKELAQGLDAKPHAGDFNLCGTQREDPTDPTSPFIDRDPTGRRCKKEKGRTTNDTWGTYLRGDISLPWGMQLTSVTGYDTYDRVIDIDLDFSPEVLFQINTDDEGWQTTQDLRLEGQFGDQGRIRWDIGGWFLREQLDVLVTNDLGDSSAAAVGTRDYTQDLYSAAGYASLAFDFWENFTLDGGFRYNWEQKKLDYSLSRGGSQGNLKQKLNDVWDEPTGTIRLTYRFRDDTHAFWKYTRGWKPGTYNATSSPGKAVDVADPETIDSFEVGLSGSWFESRLGLDVSFFHYQYKNYQLFTAQQFDGGQPEFVILNAEKAEVYGAEVDARARPWSGAFVNVRFGWLESQFLDFVQLQQERVVIGGVQTVVNRELNNTGNPLLNSPKFKVSITGEQTLQLGRWGALTARYDGVWTDTTYYDGTEGRGIPNVQNLEFLPEDTIAQPDFWLHNLRVSYRPPGPAQIEIAGWVRNLTDETYKTFGFDGSTFRRTSIYFVGDPRTYGGTLTINF